MQATMKPLISRAFKIKSKRYPLWFLRQAGRYLPEYQKIRQNYDFVSMCHTAKLAAEVTLQPLRRFDLDAAIIFSDILIPAQALGQSLRFTKGMGPELSPSFNAKTPLSKLFTEAVFSHPSLMSTAESIALVKKELTKEQALIGFAGAPWTLASYMIEGQSSRQFLNVQAILNKDPLWFADFMHLLQQLTSKYLSYQLEAGADILMLFDSWAGQLSDEQYQRHVLPAMKELFKSLKAFNKPIILYSGEGSQRLYHLDSLRPEVIAVDWRVSLSQAVASSGLLASEYCWQGNLEPQILSWADEETVRQRVKQILDEARRLKLGGHIFNVGHGLIPTTRPEAIEWVISEVRSYEF